ncbi:mitochondrial adenyl nucleotide antiporter SLC25A23-like [Hetaerina americana]|uniref:mitochondrial adenyl nucleotide antiporter SLC25A23-like n=1 Tax=Hetaerina americana TaxID=62018 RepID=UPI003A7F2352
MNEGTLWRYLVAGAVAGGVSRTCTAPLDRLKVFMQVHSKYNGFRLCLQDMIKEGGITGLWRGNVMNVTKTIPEAALRHTAYEKIKAMIISREAREATIYDRVIAGSLAGCFSQTVIYPLEVLKTRLILRQTGQYSGIIDAAVKITRNEGFRCYYRGFLPNILGVIPYSGIDLALYETTKMHYLQENADVQRPGVLLLGGFAAVSGTAGQVASYPLALVRTRLQAQVPTKSESVKSMTMTGLFRKIIEHEGFFGLYRGLFSNILKVVPAVSISYAVNDKCREALGVRATT